MTQKYLFADESGNFDFRDHTKFRGGPTRYFAVGTILVNGTDTMKAIQSDMMELRYTLARNGTPHHEPFHATEDPQHVRDAVFEVLQGHDFKIDVTVLEKAKAQPQTRVTDARFYQTAWFFHFKYFAKRYFLPDDDLLVVSASLGTKRLKKSFRSAVEDVVTQCCSYKVNRQFGHWDAAVDPCLQAVDYALWAVMRDVERRDSRSRDLIEDKINSVYDLWSVGRTYYYGPKAQRSA